MIPLQCHPNTLIMQYIVTSYVKIKQFMFCVANERTTKSVIMKLTKKQQQKRKYNKFEIKTGVAEIPPNTLVATALY